MSKLTDQVAVHLRTSDRLAAAERTIARLEARVARLEKLKVQKPESAASFKQRVFSALGAK